MNLKYKNITVSGKICTGTSTLSKALAKVLGWEHWDAGTFFRNYCQQKGLKLEETDLRSDKLRRQIDYQVRKRLKTKKNLIHEGWLAGFFAQNLKGVLKILLVCDDALRIDRLVNRDNLSVKEAKKLLKERERQNHLVWKKCYAKEWKKWVGKKKIDFFDSKLYDLVIDTYKNSKEETLKMVLKELGYDKKVNFKEVFSKK